MGTDRSATSNKWNPGCTIAGTEPADYVIYSWTGYALPPLFVEQIMRQPEFCNIGRTAIFLEHLGGAEQFGQVLRSAGNGGTGVPETPEKSSASASGIK